MSGLAEQIACWIPLSELPGGTHARIAEIRGGRQLARRLLGLGIRVDAEVTVLHRRGRGVVLAKGDIRVALGSGVSEKILVEPFTSARPTGR